MIYLFKKMIKEKKFEFYVFVLCFLLPLSLFVKFLGENRYPLITIETSIIFFFLLILSLFIFFISLFSQKAAVFISGTVIFLYFYEIIEFFDIAFKYYPLWAGIVVTGFILMVIYRFFIRRSLSDWLFFAIAAFLVFSVTAIEAYFKSIHDNKVLCDKKGLVLNENLNPVLVLVLDEHLSIGAMHENIKEAIIAKKEVVNFYERYNFLYFLNAYSRFFQTNISVSNLFNFDRLTVPLYVENVVSHQVNEVKLAKNRFFDYFKNKGYVFRIYQSYWVDFFDQNNESIEYCFQYYHGMDEIHNQDFGIIDKSLLLTGNFLAAIRIGKPLVNIAADLASKFLGDKAKRIPIIGAQYASLGPIKNISAVKQLEKDMAPFENGKVYFAYLLTPHSPYVYDEQNNIKKNPRDWTLLDIYEEHLKAYYNQVRGLYTWLDEWFKQLSRQDNFDRLGIIILTDHGSRITFAASRKESIVNDPQWERISKDIYSTIFAIKWPQFKKGAVDVIKPIETLLYESLYRPDTLEMTPSIENFVFLKDMTKAKYGGWGHNLPKKGNIEDGRANTN